jgi:hypothetical protein
VYPIIKAPLHLVVDLSTKSGQAAEGSLDVSARAAKTVVKIEVTKSRIEVVAPHQADHSPAKPDTFRITGRTVDRLRCFGEFVRPALVIPRGIGGTRGGLSGLILVGRCPALGEGAPNTDHECQPGDGEVMQNRNLKLPHALTHEFPDLLPAVRPLMPLK